MDVREQETRERRYVMKEEKKQECISRMPLCISPSSNSSLWIRRGWSDMSPVKIICEVVELL